MVIDTIPSYLLACVRLWQLLQHQHCIMRSSFLRAVIFYDMTAHARLVHHVSRPRWLNFGLCHVQLSHVRCHIGGGKTTAVKYVTVARLPSHNAVHSGLARRYACNAVLQ